MSKKYPGGFVTALSPIGGNSVAFDGTGDYLTVPTNTALNLGTGDFTLEFWWYPTTFSGVDGHGFLGGSADGAYDFVYRVSTGFNLGRINTAFDNTFAFAAVANTWYHVAYSRSGTSLRVFVNGVQIGSTATNGISYGTNGGTAIIGASTPADRWTTGYISNLRLLKGTALYTANFNPPTQLLNIPNTSLLTCNSPAIVDQSSNNFPITVTGNAAVSTLNPFPAVPYNPAPTSSSRLVPANGVWTLDQVAQYIQQGVWPPGGPSGFIGRIDPVDGTTNTTEQYSVAGTTNGELYAVGTDTSNSVVRAYIAKSTLNGVQWQRRLSGVTGAYFFDCATAASGNIYATGLMFSSSQRFGILVKYNSNGTLLWQRQLGYAGTSFVQFEGISVDSSENIYVVGISTFFGSASLILVKYDSNGNIIFQKDCGVAGTEAGASRVPPAVASNGNIYCAGYGVISGTISPIIIKYNSSGVLQWQFYLFSAGSFSSALVVDSNENVYLATGSGDTGYFTKLNSSGAAQWKIAMPSYSANSMAVDSANNIYHAGGPIVKYDPTGAVLFSRRLLAGSSTTGSSNSIAVVGDSFFVNGNGSFGVGVGVSQALFGRFPIDGTGIGTYSLGSLSGTPVSATYSTASITTNVGSQTLITTGFSDRTAGLTTSAGVLTEVTPTYSSAVTLVY